MFGVFCFYIAGCSTDGYMGVTWNHVFAGSNLATPTSGVMQVKSCSERKRKLIV